MLTKTDTLKETLSALREIGKEISLLYVEDDSMIRHEFTHFLSRFFPQIDTAQDGKEGVEKALDHPYDLIISDIEMPRLNGLEMIEQIKHRYPHQATLLISAHKEVPMLHRSVELGVDGYLFKPIEPEKTIQMLYKIAVRIQTEKENLHYKHHLESMVETKNNELIELYRIDRVTKVYTLGQFEHDLHAHSNLSLALFKINDFKNLNDLYGYEVGDSILRQCADFLREMTAGLKASSLYRISGTHFALLVPMESYDLERFCRLTAHMFEEREIQVESERMYLEMTIGIVGRHDHVSLSNADKALREAQKSGRIVVYTHDEEHHKLHTEKLKCKDDIKRALRENRFVPYYQPIIDNSSRKIIKYEALARLILPDGEVVTPGCFLSIAKETKMYPQISKMVIARAMSDFADSECQISLNLSIDDLKLPLTREFLFEQIKAFPEPERLVFELLESEGIDSYEELGHYFSRLKSYGCKIAIDDFGSGYSNFEHLAKLDIDYIKIDGSLILGLEEALLSKTIVEMISLFAQKINVKTVAEFVGTPKIESMLVDMGITESQGYLFGAPVPFEDSMRLIQSL